jgi:hypothetical protein
MNKTMKITHKKVPNGTMTIGVSDESDVFTLIKNNMKEELFVQLMEQQKQMDVVKKALDLLYYRQREILKQVVEEMETPETVGSINMFLKVSEIKDGSSFPEKYDSPSSLYKHLNNKKGNTRV